MLIIKSVKQVCHYALALHLLVIGSHCMAQGMTPEARERDFNHMLTIIRDCSPYAAAGAANAITSTAPDSVWLRQVRQCPGDRAYFDIVSRKLRSLQTPHAYVLYPSGIRSYRRNPLARWWHRLSMRDIGRMERWQKTIGTPYYGWPAMTPLIEWYAHAGLDIAYQRGSYTLASDGEVEGTHGRLKVPRGATIETIEGMAVDDYVVSVSDRAILRIDMRLGKRYIGQLFSVDPGRDRPGWHAKFRLPQGWAKEGVIRKVPGFPDDAAGDPIGPNTVCVDLSDRIGYVRIRNFDQAHEREDGEIIRRFLGTIRGNDCQLIIDIRGNTGGSAGFWMNSVVAPLINQPLRYQESVAVRKGLLDWMGVRFLLYRLTGLPDMMLNRLRGYQCMEKLDGLANYPESDWAVYRITREIEPQRPTGFRGKIFLLVDADCVSAAEMFASMAKTTGFATVVGTATGGGNVRLFDPKTFVLPESGIIFRIDVDLPLAADGSATPRTVPDILLDACPPPSRLTRNALLIDPWIKHLLGKISASSTD